MRTLALAIMGMLMAASAYCNNTSERDLGKWVQQGSDLDALGSSVSLSADGSIVAIGEPDSDINGSYSGQARIYQWNETEWIQRGNDINGEEAGQECGQSVSLSSNGNMIAIGATGGGGNGESSGHVRIYQWDGTEWIQKGNDIDGEGGGDRSGSSVSLSSDGTIVAIGAAGNDGNGESSGHVRIFQWDGTEGWNKLGSDIDGEQAYDSYPFTGYPSISVSLSSDGTIVAIGAEENDGNGESSGHVRIYQWDGTEWIQKGSDIDGEGGDDRSGSSVSLSSDGTVVAIGAAKNDGNGESSGHVRIYQWDGTEWIQKGSDIDGEAADDHFGSSVSLSGDGSTLAIGAPFFDVPIWHHPDYPSIYRWNETGLLSDDPAHAELVDRISQISLTPGPQGPPGEDGATGPQGPPGADAPCKPCADVASAAVALACKILHVNPATNIQEFRDIAEVVVATLMISANVCELDCDIGEEINAAIDIALNK